MPSLRDCPECGRSNDLFVNPGRCYACGEPWANHYATTVVSGP